MDPIALPGFELIEKIGQGGMAVVWKARQVSLDRIVAIKFLQPQFSCNAEDVQRLLAEARAAARLKHPSIVQVYDTNEVQGIYYIIMEFIAGYSVGEWLRRKKTIDEKNVLLIAECVATALHYAWTNAHIIHCDIKPDNIMVDRDGTIKVADLGLSRTVGARGGGARPTVEEVMGTPSYISPEQSRGGVELDCRTDIYSLGATLYHMVTGKRLFEQYPDAEAMDKQITDHAPDPLDLNPQLSNGMGWLIEKMLVKDRAGRQPSWAAVLDDIHAVQKGRLPASLPAAENASTVGRGRRRVLRMTAATAEAPKPAPPDGRTRRLWLPLAIALGGVVLVLAILAFIYLAPGGGSKVARPPAGGDRTNGTVALPALTVAVPPLAATPVTAARDDAREAFENAENWRRAHPGEFQAAIVQLQHVAGSHPDTKYAALAGNEIRNLRQEWTRQLDQVVSNLAKGALPYAGSNRYTEAAEVFERYRGPWAAETEPQRAARAAQYREQGRLREAQRQRETQAAGKQFDDFTQCLAATLLTGDYARAAETLDAVASNQWATGYTGTLQAWRRLLASATNINKRIADTFRAQQGETVTVGLKKGPVAGVISDVSDQHRISYEPKIAGDSSARIKLEFTLDDLSLSERLARMGADDVPEVCLIKGGLAFQDKNYAKACEYYAHTAPVLGDTLVAAVQGIESQANDEKAEAALGAALRAASIEVGPYDEQAWMQAMQRGAPNAGARETLSKQLDRFMATYGQCAFAKRAAPVLAKLAELQRAATAPAADGAGSELEIPPLSPPGQPAVDTRKLLRSIRDKNPGVMDYEVQISERNGMIYRVAILSPAIKDLSPLAELTDLREMAAGSVGEQDWTDPNNQAPLWNLSPLSRLPLRRLYLGYTSVADLSPLRGMPLKALNARFSQVKDIAALQELLLDELNLNGTGVKDITVLRGKPLRVLDISNTRVYDISPVAGAPLRQFAAANSQVKDISCLRGMMIEALNLAGTRIHDFSSLKGMPLRQLDLSDTQFRDFAYLKSMPLNNLTIRNLKPADLSFLEGLNLVSLNLQGTAIKSIESLRQMPLTWLVLNDTKVHNLAPLHDMPLEHLEIANTPVADLSPLHGMKLTHLNIMGTEVRDLSPLADMPLKSLRFDLARVKDILPLRGMPLEELYVGGDIERMRDASGWERLRKLVEMLPNLRTINDRPVRWNQGQPGDGGRRGN